MISEILNLIHIIFVFTPIIIYFLPVNYIKSIFKYIFLIFILVPLHWEFFEDQCSLTILTKSFNNLKNTETSSSFSEVYMKWLYKPIMNILGWEWNDDGIAKMVNLHFAINFILLWYYLFFVAGCELI
jgi:hypothetical protein